MDLKSKNRNQSSSKATLANLTFPIVYVPPLQPGDLNASIARLHKCVNTTLVQYIQIHALRRCHELANHYVMGRVEKQALFDYSPKLGHRLTLILREVSKADSSDATIQVQLFDSYAALAECITPGNLIALTGVRVDVSMMCSANQRIPHSKLHITAKPIFQRNFKVFFMPVYTDIYLSVEELKVTTISACKSMVAAAEKMHVNAIGVITASTPFENVNEKEWRCYITLADHTVNLEHLYECCSLNSSLLIKVISSACLHTFERGHILRISHLQITEQNNVVLGIMEMDCLSVLFQVSLDDTISVLPLHSKARIRAIEWEKAKELCCWWTAVEKLQNKCDILPSYLLSRGFMVKRSDILTEAVPVQVEDAKGHPETAVTQFPNPRKRKIFEHCDGTRKLGDDVMGSTSITSPLKRAYNVVPSHDIGNNHEMLPKSTTHSTISLVDNDGIKQTCTMDSMSGCSKELKRADEVYCYLESPIFPDDQPRHNLKNMGKLSKLDKLDHDMCFDIDCQVIGYYCNESFEKIVLKVWDGSKCPYVKKTNFADASFTVKFKDPNFADIEDYCVSVDIFGFYKQHAEIIELFEFVQLRNVHANAGYLYIPGWHYKHRGIMIYRRNPFTRNLEYDLNKLRQKLKKEDVNMTRRFHCTTLNPQPLKLIAPSTAPLCNTNILSFGDVFTSLEKIKQGFTTNRTTGAISGSETQLNAVNKATESLDLSPDVVRRAVEHTTDAFKSSAIKPQNKHLQLSLSTIGQVDMFFDIFCQVVGCYHNAEPRKIILKIWDGTMCKYAKYIKHYDSWAPVFEDPDIDDINEYCIYVTVYDEYMEMARALKHRDIVKLCNVRSRSGIFSLHGGQIRQRKIVICSPDSTIAKSLTTSLKELRKHLGKYEKSNAAIDGSNNQSCQEPSMNLLLAEDPSLKVLIDKDAHFSPDRMTDKTEISGKEISVKHNQEVHVLKIGLSTAADFFPNFVCANPIEDCKARKSSVARIKRSPVPGKFCFFGAVLDIRPKTHQVSELVKWFCKSCEYMVSSKDLKDLRDLGYYRYQCPCNNRQNATSAHVTTNTGRVLEPVFFLNLTLCDLHYEKLQVVVCGPQAETFFCNYSPVDLLKHQDVRERFATLLRSLCNAPGSLTRSSLALHCHLSSRIGKNDNTFYCIVNTQLVPFHEITTLAR